MVSRSRYGRRAASAAVLVTALLAVVVTAGPAAAGPRPRVGPHQVFDGLVNGSRDTAGPVAIQVACAGPITPGETGHPVAGQTVEIAPAAAAAHGGNTGDDGTVIEAFFGPPPPASATLATASKSTVSFRRYFLERPIPRALELPCSGTGQVTFVPFPRTPPHSRPAVVRVTYVGQP